MNTKLMLAAALVLSFFASTNRSFAAGLTASHPFAPPPAMSIQPHVTPQFDDGCDGSCTVYCSSGAEDFYETTAQMCCGVYVNRLCKDGSSASGAEWWPITCGFAEIC